MLAENPRSDRMADVDASALEQKTERDWRESDKGGEDSTTEWLRTKAASEEAIKVPSIMVSKMADFPRSPSRRLLWVVNHRTLLVPILRSLGWEVFIPKIVPDHDPGYRSAAVTYEYDAALRLPEAALRVLNQHDFYERNWTATVEDIINKYFAATVAHFSYYTATLSEAARKFRGTLIARAFGREHPRTYAQLVVGFSRREDLVTSGGGPGFSVGSIQPGKVQLSGGAEWLEARVGKRFPRNWGRRSLSNLSCRTFLSVAVVRRRS